MSHKTECKVTKKSSIAQIFNRLIHAFIDYFTIKDLHSTKSPLNGGKCFLVFVKSTTATEDCGIGIIEGLVRCLLAPATRSQSGYWKDDVKFGVGGLGVGSFGKLL